MLSLYDLKKAYDSIEHPVLLKALFEAGVNGKAWRIVKAFMKPTGHCQCQLYFLCSLAHIG